MVPNHEKKGDYYVNLCLSQIKDVQWIKKMVEREVFLMKAKHKYHLSRWKECVYGAQSWKEMRLLCESRYSPIERQTSILNMVKREVFLLKSKHQNHLSQWVECVYGTQPWKERILLRESKFIPNEIWTSIQ